MTGSGKIVTISGVGRPLHRKVRGMIDVDDKTRLFHARHLCGVDRCWSSTRTHAGRYLSLPKAAV
jgi:hypothetical protein